MRRLLIALLAGSLALAAQTAPPAAPPKKPAATPRGAAATGPSHENLKYPPLKQVTIPKIETFTLANGMKVYLLENHALPLVSGFALVRTGNLFDPPDKVGLAGMTGSVMRTGGTKSKTGEQINEELENIAASVEAGIGETSGSVSFNTLKEHTGKVLAVFKEVMTQPEFRQDKVDLIKQQTRGGISRRNDDAGGIAEREFMERVYGRNNPYGWRMEYEHVDRISRDDMIAFHKRYFFPANIMLAIQGDFETAAMRAEIEKLFSDWTASQAAVPEFPKVTNGPAPGVFVADKEDVTQTFFKLGHLGGTLREKDYPALQVAGDILGGGFASRLFKKVRTELGYAYSVGASWSANYSHPGTFSIEGSTKSASTADTLSTIREEIDRLRVLEVSDDELRTAKDTILNSFVFNFDHPSKTLNRMVTYDYHGYPKDFIFQYQKAIEAVSKADVQRAAREHLRPEALTIVAVGKAADFGKPLTGLGMPVSRVDLTIPDPKREQAKQDAGSLAAGAKLLGRVQQAVGGADKIAAVKDAVYTADSSINAGAAPMKVAQRLLWVRPSSFRQEQTLPFGKIIVYSDGKTGWIQSPQGNQPMPPPVLNQVRSELLRFPFLLWTSDKDPDRTVNAVGPATIEVADKAGNSVRLTIDEQSGLPLKSVYRMGPEELEETYADWKDVSGIKLPHKTTVSRGGKPAAEINVQEWKVNTGATAEEAARKP
ncbi:MAG: insulinase family protein [Bryobacteraceae bacterium]|nr:insulinase family protein [Bryobacteraceae bacterium]